MNKKLSTCIENNSKLAIKMEINTRHDSGLFLHFHISAPEDIFVILHSQSVLQICLENKEFIESI